MPSRTTFPSPPSAAAVDSGPRSTRLLLPTLEEHHRHVVGLGETFPVLQVAIADLSEPAHQVIREPALEAEVAW
jgi:hypothetical protein